MKSKNIIFFILLQFLGSTSFAQSIIGIDLESHSWSEYDLPALKQVSPVILRGGRPSKYGIQQLKEMGIKTIINIDNDEDKLKKEKKWAAKEELEYVSIPLSWWHSPSNKDISQILSLINDETKQPVFIHCKHGEDRTGMIIGLYRVFSENWTPENAYNEMLDLGFHPMLWALDDYFKESTGYVENSYNY